MTPYLTPPRIPRTWPRVEAIALDIEGTLISNAVSILPRPRLYTFLEEVAQLGPELLLYSGVSTPAIQRVVMTLLEFGEAPPWLAGVPVVPWGRRGPKFLRRAIRTLEARRAGEGLPPFPFPGDPRQVLLVDDMRAMVAPGEDMQWIPIAPFDPRMDPEDRARGFDRVLRMLRARCPVPVG